MVNGAWVGSTASGVPRRALYRRGKRALSGAAGLTWRGPRSALESAVRRFLRAKSSGFLARLVADRSFALAAAASLAAAGGAAALPPVELSDVAAGIGGFVINGADEFDFSGGSVSGAGDVNGDGLDDLIVGALGADPVGKGYVVFGKADGTAVDLSAVAAGVGGFVINGADGGTANSVSGAGDVNHDGLDDVIVGAFHADTDAGASYVVFGKADGTAVDLSAVAAGAGGFVINGIDPADLSGISVSGAGDVNGDGFDDVIVGRDSGSVPRGLYSYTGESYVVFGKPDGAAVDLFFVAAGAGGFVINGFDRFDQAGRTVSGAGDVNGDGLADLIVGAYKGEPSGNFAAGESYVVFGKADGAAVYLSTVAGGSGGFAITGIDQFDYSGRGVSGAGDVNGDGLDDLIVGADGADPGGSNQAGESYVVFGKADGTVVNLSAIVAGTGGFVINGIDPSDNSGRSVSGAGDVNGDGLPDVIVGAFGADPAGNSAAGESYVVFGKADGTAVNLSAGAGGFVINGIDPGDESGRSVSGAGDVNGDGLADVIVGASTADPGGNSSAGESYVVFGVACPWDCDGNGDGVVSVNDLLKLLSLYDPMSPIDCTGGTCDFNNDGCVDVVDLLKLLAHYDPTGLGCP